MAPIGFTGGADDWGADADPFAAMRGNPIFARYFTILEARYGREGAMRRWRGMSRRFRFGRRLAHSLRNEATGRVPTHDGIRSDVEQRFRKSG